MKELDDLAVGDGVAPAPLEVELVVLGLGVGEDLEVRGLLPALFNRLERVHVRVLFLDLLDQLVQLVGRLVLARRHNLEHAFLCEAGEEVSEEDEERGICRNKICEEQTARQS